MTTVMHNLLDECNELYQEFMLKEEMSKAFVFKKVCDMINNRLEEEKNQIIDAYMNCYSKTDDDVNTSQKDAEKYFNETYINNSNNGIN